LYGREEAESGEDGEAIVGAGDGFSDGVVGSPGRGVERLADVFDADLFDAGIS
jgi:hypothetical protein